MSNLYQLTLDVENLYSMLEESADLETGEIDEEILNTLTCKEEEFNNKAIAVATVWRRYDMNIDLISREIERLTAIKNKAIKIQGKLENSLTDACVKLGREKIEGISASISFRKSTKTIVDNEALLPDEYIKVTMVKKPDLTKIKKAIEQGVEVQGASLQHNMNIQIR